MYITQDSLTKGVKDCSIEIYFACSLQVAGSINRDVDRQPTEKNSITELASNFNLSLSTTTRCGTKSY